MERSCSAIACIAEGQVFTHVQLRRVLRLILDERDWWGMPRYVLGTSAGGSAALLLAARFPVQVRVLPWPTSLLESLAIRTYMCDLGDPDCLMHGHGILTSALQTEDQ